MGQGGWPGRRAQASMGVPVLSVSSVVECSARRNSSQIKYKPANPAESNTSAQLMLSSLSTERKVHKFQIHAKNRPCQKNTVSQSSASTKVQIGQVERRGSEFRHDRPLTFFPQPRHHVSPSFPPSFEAVLPRGIRHLCASAPAEPRNYRQAAVFLP
jgi:hypothetical protein